MKMITKGTTVTITTTNGGEITATLLHNHHLTYDAVIQLGNGYAVIPSYRIKTVTPYPKGWEFAG
jgi:hypothetical protein